MHPPLMTIMLFSSRNLTANLIISGKLQQIRIIVSYVYVPGPAFLLAASQSDIRLA